MRRHRPPSSSLSPSAVVLEPRHRCWRTPTHRRRRPQGSGSPSPGPIRRPTPGPLGWAFVGLGSDLEKDHEHRPSARWAGHVVRPVLGPLRVHVGLSGVEDLSPGRGEHGPGVVVRNCGHRHLGQPVQVFVEVVGAHSPSTEFRAQRVCALPLWCSTAGGVSGSAPARAAGGPGRHRAARCGRTRSCTAPSGCGSGDAAAPGGRARSRTTSTGTWPGRHPGGRRTDSGRRGYSWPAPPCSRRCRARPRSRSGRPGARSVARCRTRSRAPGRGADRCPRRSHSASTCVIVPSPVLRK